MYRCAFCKYELTDQTTFYVEEYHLTAVRCPECGRAQPADPAMAPEKRLLAMFRWIGLMRLPAAVLVAIGTAAVIAGIAQSAAYVGTESAAVQIRYAVPSDVSQSRRMFLPWMFVPADWWADFRDTFEKSIEPSVWSLQWDGMTESFWLMFVFPLAVLLVLLLGSGRARPRIRRAILGAPIALSAIGLSVYFLVQPIAYFTASGPAYHTGEIAADRYGQGVAWVCFGIGVALYWLSVNFAIRRHNKLAAWWSERKARRQDAADSLAELP